MTWLRLSLNEWRRRPLRTAIISAGVAIAIAALYSLLVFQRGYREGVREELNRLGAHVLLVPKGCPYDAASMALHGASWPCYLKEAYLKEVRAVPGVLAVAPVFMSAAYHDKGSQVVAVGVDTNILSLKPHWSFDGTFPARDGDVLAGSDAARKRALAPGRRDTAISGLPGGATHVSGVLKPTHGPDDTFLFLELKDAQRRFHHSNELTHVLIRLIDPDDLDRVVGQLRGCDAGLAMNVVPLAHVFQTIQSMVNSTRLLLGCIAVIALLIAVSGVTNTILIAVSERTREIGVLRAIGATRGMIFRLIWLETLQVCAVGAVVGVLLAAIASSSIEAWVRTSLPLAPQNSMLHWDWTVAAACVGAALLLGTLAALLPAWRAAQVPPMVAIKRTEGGL